jgi:DNA processing protein
VNASPSAIAPDARGTETRDWAVLATAIGVGPAGLLWLVARFGSAGEVLRIAGRPRGPRTLLTEAERRSPASEGGSRWRLRIEIAEAIATAARDGPRLLRRIEKLGLRILIADDPEFPARLLTIDEPVPLLYVRGDPDAMSAERAVAVVGTRRPTEAGVRLAAEIATSIAAAGGVVISGLAHGIDGAAHGAAVSAQRPTVAVLGSGHARLYPARHRALAANIVATGGCVVSELPPDQPGNVHTFPQRNRIISGLSDATVVVEAPPSSGALITADRALRQGRDVYLTPGAIGARVTAGSLEFLHSFPEQARIVASVPLLLADLGFDVEIRPGAVPSSLAAGAVERQLAGLIVAGATTADELVEGTGLAVATVLSALTLLEMRGLVVAAYGRYRPGAPLQPIIRPRSRPTR